MNDRGQRIRADTSRADAAPAARQLWEQGQRVERDLEDLGDAVRQAVTIAQRLIRWRLRHRPYATLITAAGVGYVLGGGLPRVPFRPLLGVGGRIAYGTLLTRVLQTLAENPDR